MYINGRRYFIEPLLYHAPNDKGQLLHAVYEKPYKKESLRRGCGTSKKWEDAWKERFLQELHNNENAPLNVKSRSLHSIHRYLETLIVADKKFLEYHKNIDYEAYILTIMNMVNITFF